MKSLKPQKGAKFKPTHTSKEKIGQGDYYGSGINQKFGKTARSYINEALSKKKINKPPKKLA